LVVRHVAKRPSLRGQSARSSTETPFEIIGRVARYAGVLAYDGPDGGLVIANVGASTIASGFAQGSNVQAAMANLTLDERFSIYQPGLTSVNSLHDIGSGQFPLKPTRDEGVQRFRSLIAVSDQAQNGRFIAERRAQWETACRRGRSQAVRVTRDSWRDSAGAPTTPTAFVTIDLSSLKPQPFDPSVISEVYVPNTGAACAVGNLQIPSSTVLVVDGTMILASGANAMMPQLANSASTVLIVGVGTLDGNRANQTGISAGVSNAGSPTNVTVRGLTLGNRENWPVNLTNASHAWLSRPKMTNSGNTPEFAIASSDCPAS
jgi:hypothetical protein